VETVVEGSYLLRTAGIGCPSELRLNARSLRKFCRRLTADRVVSRRVVSACLVQLGSVLEMDESLMPAWVLAPASRHRGAHAVVLCVAVVITVPTDLELNGTRPRIDKPRVDQKVGSFLC